MTKEKLKEYKDTKKELDDIKLRIEEYEHKKTSIKSQILRDMPVGSNEERDRLGAILVLIEELLDDYYEKEADLLKKQCEVETAIGKLKDTLERTVLRYVYFDDKRFEEISCIIKYSYTTVKRIHRRAIKKLAEL